jgi:hypothetical protein
MSVGPRVAFVDDIESQITELDAVVRDLQAGSIFFNANPEFAVFPETPIETVKLLFLDLYYTKEFQPEISAQWVKSIIPKKSNYELVIWSRDTDEVDRLFPILEKIELKPTSVEVWQKSTTKPEEIRSRINELTLKLPNYEKIKQEDFYGEIIEVGDDGVLINCKINIEPAVFQVRKFDLDLVSNIANLVNGTFVKIITYTGSGARLIGVFEERQDRSEIFVIEDFFKGLQGGAFFLEG